MICVIVTCTIGTPPIGMAVVRTRSMQHRYGTSKIRSALTTTGGVSTRAIAHETIFYYIYTVSKQRPIRVRETRKLETSPPAAAGPAHSLVAGPCIFPCRVCSKRLHLTRHPTSPGKGHIGARHQPSLVTRPTYALCTYSIKLAHLSFFRRGHSFCAVPPSARA